MFEEDKDLLEGSVPDGNDRLYSFTQSIGGSGRGAVYNAEGLEVTESELRQYFEDNAQTQEMFGDFDNYMAYMNERQDLIDSGEYSPDFWNAEYEGVRDELQLEDTGSTGIGGAGANDYVDFDAQARESAFNRSLFGDPVGADLLRRYGVQTTVFNEDGDTFNWNGTEYVRTHKVDDGFDTAGFLRGMIESVVISGLTAGLGGWLTQAAGLNPQVAQGIVSGATDLARNGELSVGTLLSLSGMPLSEMGEVTDEALQEIIGNEVWGAVTDELLDINDYYQNNEVPPEFGPEFEADINTDQPDPITVDEEGNITIGLPFPTDNQDGGSEAGGEPESGGNNQEIVDEDFGTLDEFSEEEIVNEEDYLGDNVQNPDELTGEEEQDEATVFIDPFGVEWESEDAYNNSNTANGGDIQTDGVNASDIVGALAGILGPGVGNGAGEGAGDGSQSVRGAQQPASGMLSSSNFKPFMSGISYNPSQVSPVQLAPRTNYLDELTMITQRLRQR